MLASRIAKVCVVACVVFAMAKTSSGALVVYYGMNETTNPSLGETVVDSSGNGRNSTMASDAVGSPVGAVVGVASANAGLYGTAYDFTAGALNYTDNFSNIPTGNWTRDGALTYAAWVKPNSIQSFSRPTMAGTTGGSYDFRIAPSGSDWSLQLQSGNTVTSSLISAATIPSDEWTHVAVTKDVNGSAGTNLASVSFYINGVLAESGTIARAGSGTNIIRLFVGTASAATMYYEGGLDEVRIYNEVLDGATIAGLAAVPEPGSTFMAVIGLIAVAGSRLRKRRRALEG